ncbi:MAG: sensory box protein [Micavibrio sp.]|nr:sensory box protein [Micavibrio sp.]
MIIVSADGDKKKSSLSNDGQERPGFTNFAQMMVLVNGLVLTAVTAAILSFFINDTLKSDYRRNADAAGQSLEQNLAASEMGFRMVASMLYSMPAPTDKALRDMMEGIAPNLSYYDRLIYVTKVNNQWILRRLFESPNIPADAYDKNDPNFQAKLVDYVSRNATTDMDIQILTDVPGTQYAVKSGMPQLTDRPVVFVKRFASDADHPESLVIALTRFAKLIPNDWISGDVDLAQVVIRNDDNTRRIFTIDWTPEEGDAQAAAIFRSDRSIPIGRNTLQIEIDAAKTGYGIVLEKSPFAMMLFGLLLTAMGLLYVRNNQRQANRLSTMNKALAQKNFEMNSEAGERERLNQILRKSERENRAIINAVSDIIFEMQTDGEILFLNQTWEKVTGFEIGRSINRNLFDMLHPQDQADQKAQFQQMVKGQKPAYRSFTRLRSSDGSFRSIELAISMLRQDENKVTRVVGTITDVEERRRAERALSEAEKTFRAIVENNASGIYQLTPEGHYLSANPAMAKLLGYDSAEVFMREIRNAHEQVYKEYREHMAFFRDVDVNGPQKNFETRVGCKDGTQIWVSENARAVKDDSGNVLYYEGGMEEITQRKEAEIQLREAKIESDLANRAKSEFLANMSHELRTPLNAIIGFSEIIKDEVFGPMGQPQYSEYANDIYASGKHLLKIINDVLDVARIEAGERHLNEALIDVSKAAATCIELVASKLDAGRLTMINMIDENTPKLVCEEVALKQMMTNLLSNAIKFTPAGGRITLSSQLNEEGVLRISVTDTGVGLDSAELDRAMSRLGNVDAALSRSNSGMGLGLTLVSSLMQIHGGSFEMFSQKGLGTTATMVFPVKRVQR